MTRTSPPEWARIAEPGRRRGCRRPIRENRPLGGDAKGGDEASLAASTFALLTVAAVADLLNVSTKTVRRMIMRGDLTAIRVGRAIRVHPDAVERCLSVSVEPPRIGSPEMASSSRTAGAARGRAR